MSVLDGPLEVTQPSGSQMGFLKVRSVSGNERRTEEQPRAQQYLSWALSIWVPGRNLSKGNGCPVFLDIGNMEESDVGVRLSLVVVVMLGLLLLWLLVALLPSVMLWAPCSVPQAAPSPGPPANSSPPRSPRGVLPPVIHLPPGAFPAVVFPTQMSG